MLNIVPYEINQNENYSDWEKMFDKSYSYDGRQDQGLDHGSLDLD